ncbi:PASTA domain-containing protein [Nonomuraea spiralis]|uniref:PASTA domain-containing protein n=1 Tax=Nonomuraea spiralis TaxID=46182 RepID=A0ABV5IXJ4_9ACTN|nr:PASTA domain-containing protein [Nonomuraea spiralis]
MAVLVLATGFHTSAAVADTAPIVHAWGYNFFGQVGNGTNDTPVTRPIPMVSAGGHDVVQVSGVYLESYGLHADGSLWTWGNGTQQIPEPVPGLPPIKQVSSGIGHTLAVGRDGSLWAWGSNDFGELGDGTTDRTPSPVKVPITGVVQAAAGTGYSLALRSNGEVFAWGLNRFGQLGDGTTVQRATPVRVKVPYGITQVSATGEFGMALRYDGSVWSWGTNFSGELGDGTTTDRPMPVRVDRHVSGIKEIAAGSGHTLALGGDGTVWAWGRNWAGQLGDGTVTDHATPVHLGLSGVAHVSAGQGESLAVDTAGTLRYWGDNTFGQAGNGVASQNNPVISPTAVNGLSGVVTASAGIAVLAVAAPGSVVVPDLTGTLGVLASRPLLAVGLLLGTKDTTPDSRLCNHLGEVVSQSPQPGSTVPAGSKVDIVVAVQPGNGCF